MASLEIVAAPDRVLFGTDFPYTSIEVVADEVKSLADQDFDPPRQRAAIDRGNALALFPRLQGVLGH